jgi:hypothetical protein
MIKEIARWILKDELDTFVLEQIKLKNNVDKLANELVDLKMTDVLEEQYNNKYPKVDRSQYKTITNRNLLLDVRLFLGNHNNMKFPKFEGNDDEIVLKAQDWVVDNVTYTSDADQYGLKEYWGVSYETLERKKGDCDDGAILMYDILRANGIPAWKLRVNCGYAINPRNGKSVGHAYVTYYSQQNAKWVAVDWCYFPNADPIKNQPEYKDNSIYGDIWYSFNEEFCWSTSK